MSEGEGSGRKDDVVLLHSPTESGDGIRVLRKRDDTIELGELRPMREGQPIHGDVVRLTQRSEHAMLYDCEVMVPAQKPRELPAAEKAEKTEKVDAASAPAAASHKGPARVTSEAYRGGWDAIFGGRRGSNQAN